MRKPNSGLIGLPDLKIKLEGSLDDPLLVNHSGRPLAGYVLKVENDTGVPSIWQVFPSLGIPDGETIRQEQPAARQVHKDYTPVIIHRVSLDAVVFGDTGEISGPDTADSVRFLEAHSDAIRNFAVQVLSDVSRIDLPRPKPAPNRTGAQMYADGAEEKLTADLLAIREASGVEAAREVAFNLSQMPKVWKGQSK